MGKILGLWVAFGLAVWSPGQTTRPVSCPSAVFGDSGLVYSLKVSSTPRPLRIHILRGELDKNRIEPVVLIAPDPDGNGPAEAALELPETLARQTGGDLLVLINANAFSGLPDASGKRSSNWHVGMPVDICGLAASKRAFRSESTKEYESVWFDHAGRIHIGTPGKNQDVCEGLAGFRQLLRNKKVLDAPGGPIHPRTALGTNPDGKVLWLVVVDGRQKGFSEGVTLEELAKIMLDLGCVDAVNLDGGGSSIMMLAKGDGSLAVMNSPSGRVNGQVSIRPIPVALAIRKKPAVK